MTEDGRNDDETTVPPPGSAGTEDEKTVMAPSPGGAGRGVAADKGDTGDTGDTEDDERTIFAPTPGPARNETDNDADRTIIGTTAPTAGAPASASASASEDEDEDRTVFAPSPAAHQAEPGTPDGEDRTNIAGAPAAPPPPQPTQVPQTPQPAALGGSTYAPPGTLSPAARAVGAATVVPTDVPTQTENTSSYTPPPPDMAPTPLSSIEPGIVIGGQYRVDGQLDQGGMGRVYRGWDLNTDAEVAIKVILPEMAEDKKVADMFRREAKTLRSLHHDAICRFFNYIPPNRELNLHALVMGFIEGTKLSDRLKRTGPLPEQEAIRLAMRLADGLSRAHEVGVVHRDLSPDNVMLPDNDTKKAVLIDFGISRSERIKDVTLGNEFAGKLKYVSPEQLGAYGNDAQGPSDIYSLGLLMTAMLLGKPLPMGDTIMEAVQMRQSVPDLSTVPVPFQDLLYKMLQPDPSHRLPTMRAVIEELAELADGETGYGTRSPRPVKDKVVEGLQAVPMAASSVQAQAPIDLPKVEVPKPRSRGLGLIMLLVLAAAGGGGYYAYDQGLFALPEAAAPSDPVAEGLTRVAGSRATFLAETLPEGCAFATIRAQSAQAGLMEGFAASPELLDGVQGRFLNEFQTATALVTREVPEAHCPAVEMVRALQGTRGAGVELALDANALSRQEGIVGRLHGSAGRQNWLGLVDPSGNIFSLMRQFEDAIGDERRFSFRLPRATPGVYMVVATASDAPLVRAGALQDGTGIADFLPLLERELATDGQGAADIAFLELLP
ncbi:MAG: serine/threonine-protein kinase [Pseudomonadota bacterium]